MRRVVPAMRTLNPEIQLDIASCSGKAATIEHPLGEVFDDYTDALRRSRAELVYISLHNSAHYEWALKSIQSGRHVVVDKPAFLTLNETERAVELADKRRRCLVEATAFEYHYQFSQIKTFLDTYGPLIFVSAQFNIPLLPLDNFRNHRYLGGGCLADMGPYAAAVVRCFGSGECIHVKAIPGKRHPETGVDLGFSVLAGFTDGLRIGGDFGFGGEYVNRILLLAKGGTLTIERIFSPPPDYPPEWQTKIGNTSNLRVLKADDAFKSFFVAVELAIETGAHGVFARNLSADAKFRHILGLNIVQKQYAE